MNLSHSVLRECLLLDTQFEECQLIGADLEESKIIDANFSHCKLQGASFNYCEGGSHIESKKYGIFLGIHGVNFRYADLRDTTFRYARIAGDFRHAQLDGVNFTGADLRGSKMLISDREHVKLTEQQRESIEWVSK
ncbi:Serine/threonine-protein kinase B [compost metagenome]